MISILFLSFFIGLFNFNHLSKNLYTFYIDLFLSTFNKLFLIFILYSFFSSIYERIFKLKNSIKFLEFMFVGFIALTPVFFAYKLGSFSDLKINYFLAKDNINYLSLSVLFFIYFYNLNQKKLAIISILLGLTEGIILRLNHSIIFHFSFIFLFLVLFILSKHLKGKTILRILKSIYLLFIFYFLFYTLFFKKLSNFNNSNIFFGNGLSSIEFLIKYNNNFINSDDFLFNLFFEIGLIGVLILNIFLFKISKKLNLNQNILLFLYLIINFILHSNNTWNFNYLYSLIFNLFIIKLLPFLKDFTIIQNENK